MSILRKLLIYWLGKQKQKDGRFPEDIFYASANIFGEACLELIIVRQTPEGLRQIYLTRRDEDDLYYPGALHLPGTRKLPDDTDKLQLLRIIGETPLNINWLDIKCFFSMTIQCPRGTEYADVRRVEIPYNANDEGFYDIGNLPYDVIDSHKEFIQRDLELLIKVSSSKAIAWTVISNDKITIVKEIIGNVWCWCQECGKSTPYYWITENDKNMLKCIEHEDPRDEHQLEQ